MLYAPCVAGCVGPILLVDQPRLSHCQFVREKRHPLQKEAEAKKRVFQLKFQRFSTFLSSFLNDPI